MKKVLLSVFAIAALMSATVAQKVTFQNHPGFKDMGLSNPDRLKKNTSNKGEFISDWYDWSSMYNNSNVGSSLQTYVGFINNDSLFKFNRADGTIDYNFWFGGGGIIDPKDDLLQLTDKPQNQLSRFNSYRLDSIAFSYLYVRNVDSVDDGMGNMMPVVDSLKVYYYKGTKIRRLTFQTSGNRLALPVQDWDKTKRLPGPTSYNTMQSYALSSGVNEALDTTRVSNNNGGFENGWFSKIVAFAAPAGIEIIASPNGSTADNLVGFSYHFESGVPAVKNGDTAVYAHQFDPNTFTGRRANYFGYRYASVQTGGPDWDNKNYNNTSLFFPRWAAYKPSNSWDGFVSGNAFVNDLFQETYYHLTVIGNIAAGLSDGEGNVKLGGLYPNPTNNTTTVRFGIKNAANTSIELVNVVGQTVKTINFGKVEAGNHEYALSVDGLKTGVYFVKVISGNSVKTERLVVAE